jgi:serine protease Do
MKMMRTLSRRAWVVALSLVALGGAAPQGRAEGEARWSRETPIVRAVKKTRKGVVTLKVLKTSSWGGGKRDIVGTGVIVDERGYLITNHHVIDNAERINAHLYDGTVVKAQLFAQDPSHDLAILRLPTKKKLQAITLGPASDLMVGETVIAIGNPYGYTNTVSTGIISALGREIKMPSGATLTNLIQTNASINPGNSGGPLLNINAELIGINVALREGAQNIAFALNADTVKAVLSKHLSAGKVARLKHGLSCGEEVSEGKVRQKVVVERVAERSPAARAGLKKGDVILKVGERRVQNRFDVERALWSYKAGDRVQATILRAGKETTVALTLAGGDSRVTRLPRSRR